MLTAPKVTVFIPVYNRAAYIVEAIESILAQTYSYFELLLVDDGSTDDSLHILRSYRDPRIRVISNDHNLGIPQTRNKGLALARGEYIALLDSDDFAYPDRLAQQVSFLDQHPQYAAIGSWVAVQKGGQRARNIGMLPVSSPEVRARLLFHCSLTQSAVMARTAVLREYGYGEPYTVCSDFDLWVRLAKTYRLGNLPQFLVRRRLHGERVTADRAQLVKQKKMQLFSQQLAELGVQSSPADVDHHYLLLRMRTVDFVPDWEYLRWAEAWLRMLQAANLHKLHYPPAVFAQVVAEVWLAICWQAQPTLGWQVWNCFCRSPLGHTIASSVRKYVSLWTTRRFPQ